MDVSLWLHYRSHRPRTSKNRRYRLQSTDGQHDSPSSACDGDIGSVQCKFTFRGRQLRIGQIALSRANAVMGWWNNYRSTTCSTSYMLQNCTSNLSKANNFISDNAPHITLPPNRLTHWRQEFRHSLSFSCLVRGMDVEISFKT